LEGVYSSVFPEYLCGGGSGSSKKMTLFRARLASGLTFLILFLLGAALGMAADKGLTIVVKKDDHHISGLSTNGITRWSSTIGSGDEEVTSVNQSGNTAMISVMNKKTGKTRILNYDAEKGILRFSQSVN
jgi:hypothetical protein